MTTNDLLTECPLQLITTFIKLCSVKVAETKYRRVRCNLKEAACNCYLKSLKRNCSAQATALQ